MNQRKVKRRSSRRSAIPQIEQKASRPQSKAEKVLRRRWLSVLVIFIAMTGTVVSYRYGSASMDYYYVKNVIDEWQKNGAIQSNEDYLSAKSAIDSALALHHNNPLYLDLSAQIKEWSVVSGINTRHALLSAKADYLAASKIRPLWPVTWANLAMIKWRLQEFDDEFLRYLEKADSLGELTPEVHLLYTRLGISLYKSNNPLYTQFKDRIHRRILMGLRDGAVRQEVVLFIAKSDARKDVCRWLKPIAPNTSKKQLSC